MNAPLVDSADLHATAWWDAFDFGHDIDFEAIRSQIDKGGDQLMSVFLGEAELDEKADHLEKHRSELLRKHFLDQVTAFPAVRKLFQQLLADGKKIAVASSAKEDELERYKGVTQIEDLIHTETSLDDAEESKPYPDIFQAGTKRLGDIRPAAILVIGDTPYDCGGCR